MIKNRRKWTFFFAWDHPWNCESHAQCVTLKRPGTAAESAHLQYFFSTCNLLYYYIIFIISFFYKLSIIYSCTLLNLKSWQPRMGWGTLILWYMFIVFDILIICILYVSGLRNKYFLNLNYYMTTNELHWADQNKFMGV